MSRLDQGGLDRHATPQPEEEVGRTVMKIEHLDARCFLCGAPYGPFDTARRLCDCVRPLGFPEGELPCYVTILPEPRDCSVRALPSVWTSRPSDVFALAAEDKGSPISAAALAARGARDTAAGEEAAYPFGSDLLAREHHLRCGNTI